MPGHPLPSRSRNDLKVYILALIFFTSLQGMLTAGANDQVKLKILAVNPSADAVLKTEVRYFLPKEVRPEHVLDAADMELKYDKEKGSYYAVKTVQLAPKETQEYIIMVKNIWFVDSDEIEKVRSQAQKSAEVLKNTKYGQSAQLLTDKVNERLSQIEEEQAKDMGMKKRIDLFHSHTEQLKDMENEVLSISALRQIHSEEGEEVRTAKFTITAENPSSEVRDMNVRSILPKAVKASDVLDAKGFTVLYDHDYGSYILEKLDKFQGKESKKYEIEIKDIWYIPDSELKFLKEQTEKGVGHFKGTEFENYAKEIANSIFGSLDSIMALQDEVAASESLQDRIRAFVLNQQRFELAKKKFKELQDLMLEIPMERKSNLIDQVKQSIKDVVKLLDVLTVGFKPDLSTTWWIILGVIAFIGIFATSFYVIWMQKLSSVPWGKKSEKKSNKKSAPPAPILPGGPPELEKKAA